ncbi:MAG: hypothetical protein GXY44_04600 [Phycisphaerales bacterium]|nr:hypothetical protein [Phycisphaerales bacterium]
MPDDSYRNRSLRQASSIATVTVVTVGLVLMVYGLVELIRIGTTGLYMLAGGAILISVASLLQVLASMLMKTEANLGRLHQVTLDQHDILQRLEPLVKIISDNSRISDAARSLSNRERELDALRQAIREEMYKGDWEAANYLIEQMEQRFGYKEESKSLREEMATAREMTIEEKLHEAVAHIAKLMDEYRWTRAGQEIQRLIKLFPRHERINALPAELNRRKEVRKQELLTQWNSVVQREEIDKGIEILTELDQYLSSAEAAQLQESARHVFKARLLQMGVRFGLAVQEARWRDALEIGVQIREEFPNSRIAREIGAKIETLRLRAGFIDEGGVAAKPPPPSSKVD